MREVLFKGKRKDNGEWVKGMLLATDVIIPCGQDFFIEANSIIDAVFTGYEVIPKTVGQFTGMFDSTKWEQLTKEEQLDWLKNHTIDEWNGRMIFEGDIVKAECDLYHGENKKERVTHIGTVIYDKKFCQFGINVAGFSKCYVLNRWKGDYNEVIGNIHDNKELLDVK